MLFSGESSFPSEIRDSKLAYRQLSVEQSVFLDHGVALGDPRQLVVCRALAVHSAVEDGGVGVS